MTSNVNGKAEKQKLSPNRMEALKEAVFRICPIDGRENMKDVWATCIRAIDESGRRLNSQKKN